MNRKVIKSILNKKLNEWVSSIEDESVRKLAKNNTIVTGGAITSMLLNEEVKDFDLYFRDKNTTFAVAKYYVQKFNDAKKTCVATVVDGANLPALNDMPESGLEDQDLKDLNSDRIKIFIKSRGVAAEDGKERLLDQPFDDVVTAMQETEQVDESVADPDGKGKYRPVFLSSNAITLANNVQLVVRFYGEPDVIHQTYDFVHCTNYYDYGKNDLVLKPEALECILNKELKYQGSRYPLCSIIRTRKFIKRGWNINAGQYLKMAFQISQLDLTDIKVLEDQLVGVDSAYFSMLIDSLKAKQGEDPGFKIEESYISTIIDRIF